MNNEFDNNYDKDMKPEPINNLGNNKETENNQENNKGIENKEQFNNNTVKEELAYHYWEDSAARDNPTTQRTNEDNSTYGYQSPLSNVNFILPNRDEEPKTKKSSKGGFVKKAGKLVLIAAVFGVIAGASFQGTGYLINQLNSNSEQVVLSSENVNNEAMKQIQKENTIATTNVSPGIAGNNDVSNVVEGTMPSIVSITSTVPQSYSDFFGNQYDEDAQGSGSGIIVGKNDTELLIATNNHVITDSTSLKVTFINDAVVDAKIKGTDETSDLAVVAVKVEDLKENTLKSIKVATIGDSKEVKVGQMAIAIGNALGYGQSVTVGYISAKDREVKIDSNTMTLLQTDAAINPGNSGGALLNVNGEVIGINSVKYASNEVEGMGYAIPISKAIPIIEELMNRVQVKEGEEGFLGVMGKDLTAEFSSTYNIPLGAYVLETIEGGPAQKAGILPGDIIIEINKFEANSMSSVKERVSSYPAGTKITVTAQRRVGSDYVKKDFEVTLEKQDTTVQNNSKSTEGQNSEEGNLIIPPFGYKNNK